MSHPFGDIVWQHLIRKRGLSQSKLAQGIDQEPAVVTRMFNGKALTGPRSRERVVAIIGWLHQQGVLNDLEEANAILAAADKHALAPDEPVEARLLQLLDKGGGASAEAHDASLRRPHAPPRRGRILGAPPRPQLANTGQRNAKNLSKHGERTLDGRRKRRQIEVPQLVHA